MTDDNVMHIHCWMTADIPVDMFLWEQLGNRFIRNGECEWANRHWANASNLSEVRAEIIVHFDWNWHNITSFEIDNNATTFDLLLDCQIKIES